MVCGNKVQPQNAEQCCCKTDESPRRSRCLTFATAACGHAVSASVSFLLEALTYILRRVSFAVPATSFLDNTISEDEVVRRIEHMKKD